MLKSNICNLLYIKNALLQVTEQSVQTQSEIGLSSTAEL